MKVDQGSQTERGQMKLQSKGAPWGPCGLFWLLRLSLWSKDRPFTMSCWPLTWMPSQSQIDFLSSLLPVTSKSWGLGVAQGGAQAEGDKKKASTESFCYWCSQPH